MKVLGIETSCDETAAAVVEDGCHVLSNVVWSQVAIHAKYRGVVPEIASRNHLRALVPVVEEALGQAKATLELIDGIAVTSRPGLIGSLLVGTQFAKSLAWASAKPLVGVNHVEAHIMAAFLGDTKPRFPFVALAVSGGHTSLHLVEGIGRTTLLGRTRDDAAGEAFDKAATLLGLPYPGGVSIDRVSRGRNHQKVRFPRAMVADDSLDMSFSGLKTALKRYLETQKGLSFEDVADIAASFQEAVVDTLVAKTSQAVKKAGVRDVVVAGGVAANTRLREKMAELALAEGLRLHLVPTKYCTDNAAMVAALGYHYLFGEAKFLEGVQRDLAVIASERHVLDGW